VRSEGGLNPPAQQVSFDRLGEGFARDNDRQSRPPLVAAAKALEIKVAAPPV